MSVGQDYKPTRVQAPPAGRTARKRIVAALASAAIAVTGYGVYKATTAPAIPESKATPEQQVLIQEIKKGAKTSGVECYDKSGDAGGYLTASETKAQQKELIQEVLRGDIAGCTSYKVNLRSQPKP